MDDSCPQFKHCTSLEWSGSLGLYLQLGLQSCSMPNREEIILSNQWKRLGYGDVSRIQNFLFSGSILQLGVTCLGDCSPIPLTGSPAPSKNLATDSSSDEFDDSSCSQCSFGARFNNLHLIFSCKTIPKFLHSLLRKQTHHWNLERRKQPSTNTSSRAEKQHQS